MITAFPKITVVTPNFNQGVFLEKTIRSVLDQNYKNLEYIIMDAGSTDGSLEIIKKYERQLTYWESKPDKGMYDAINQAFNKSTGEIMCWINSDDVLWEGSLNYVSEIFSRNHKVQWLQGFPSVIDENDQLIFQRLPVYSKFFFYLGKHTKNFAFIQQESTFWRRSLWERAGNKINTEYSLAADFDLWMRFFEHETLYCTKRQLAAFRKRLNQKSGNTALYLTEAGMSLVRNKSLLSTKDKLKLALANGYLKDRFRELIIGKAKYV